MGEIRKVSGSSQKPVVIGPCDVPGCTNSRVFRESGLCAEHNRLVWDFTRWLDLRFNFDRRKLEPPPPA